MTAKKTIESKKLHGIRENDDDGFTYVHGSHKQGRVKRTRNRKATIRHIRQDKRAAKAADTLRDFKEMADL